MEYSDRVKAEVVEFVKTYEAQPENKNRSGIQAAKKKFKINPISIKKWCIDSAK